MGEVSPSFLGLLNQELVFFFFFSSFLSTKNPLPYAIFFFLGITEWHMQPIWMLQKQMEWMMIMMRKLGFVVIFVGDDHGQPFSIFYSFSSKKKK